MNKALVFASVLFITIISGCSTGTAIRIGDAQYPPTNPKNVKVYLDPNNIKLEYEEIGVVSAEKTAGWTFTNVSEEDVIEILVKKAASIGADAIILQQLSDESVPWAVQGAGGTSSLDKKKARATAIRFKR